jgi:hypothetical protein
MTKETPALFYGELDYKKVYYVLPLGRSIQYRRQETVNLLTWVLSYSQILPLIGDSLENPYAELDTEIVCHKTPTWLPPPAIFSGRMSASLPQSLRNMDFSQANKLSHGSLRLISRLQGEGVLRSIIQCDGCRAAMKINQSIHSLSWTHIAGGVR